MTAALRLHRLTAVHLITGLIGASVLLWLVLIDGAALLQRADEEPTFCLLLAFLLLGDVLVLVRSSPTRVETSTASAFAFAMLLLYGTTAAAVGMALASVLWDVARRKPVGVTVLQRCPMGLVVGGGRLGA